ncbi:MAG: tRNA pseudouridine(55) synthase TruB [Chloroflexi bacterium]|nr:tRNA pseudouridine(55) synthase TruB [Chloroflexota bacterium]
MTESGFLNINKPPGLTSHDVVGRARRGLGIKKIGHAGTLDPLADGVLILCLGSATRLSEYVMASVKHYRARVRLGIVTDTYDAEGRVVQERDATAVQREDVERALPAFLGEITQIPPMYSAVKQGGRRLYELARAGQEVERAARQVWIEGLVITDWSPPLFTLEVTCSAGTYIRSLVYDLGEALGVGAFLAGLTRTASGVFTLEKSLPLETLLALPGWRERLISPQAALADWPSIRLDADQLEYIRHGRAIPAAETTAGDFAFAYAPGGDLVAAVQKDGSLWRPRKVFL